jgi:deoxycytidine triphosphate deaminase
MFYICSECASNEWMLVVDRDRFRSGFPVSLAGHQHMPTLITGDRLRDAVKQGTFIKNGDPGSVEGVKYDLRMGSRVLKAAYSQPIDMSELSAIDRSAMSVDPGEAVFVLTQEQLDLPNNFMAILSPKRRLAHGGIIILGGLSVDPLYKGPLWIGLYNFSSTPFPLQSGRKLIAAMFYELSGEELAEFPIPEAAGINDFPDELVTLIKNYRPVELKSLTDALTQTQRRLDELTNELRDDRAWKRDFQEAIDRQSQQIDRLLEGLKEEKDARQQEDRALRTRLESMTGMFATLRTIWVLVALFISAIIGYLVRKFVG